MDSREFKDIRKKLSLTQSELADLVGVSTRTIQNMEYGDQLISIPIAEFLMNRVGEMETEKEDIIKMFVKDRDYITMNEMVEFCMNHHMESFLKHPSVKMLIEVNRNEAKAELLEKHIVLRNSNK